MLDAFKSMSGHRGKAADKQTSELGLLIASAREERSAISTMLVALTTRSSKLAPLTESMDQAMQMAAAVTTTLDRIAGRLDALDDRTQALESLESRIRTLTATALQAEQTTEKSIGPDGELQKHREAMLQLASQALETRATIDTLKTERATLEEVRAQVRAAQAEAEQSVTQAGLVRLDLEQLRRTSSELTQDYTSVRETSREARDHTDAAMAMVTEVETKLSTLSRVQELSSGLEERLDALNALAEHVARKGKSIESQQQAVEHAVVQANRVNEMVWAMDLQIGKLNEGMKHAARAEETTVRIEKITQEAHAQLELATRTQQQVQRDTDRLMKDAFAVGVSIRDQVDTLAIRRKEFDAFDERVRSLQASLADAEARIEALGAKDRNLVELAQKLDLLTRRVEALLAQSDELTTKQVALESLHDRLGQVDELARKTTWQLDALRQSRADVDLVRKEVQDFYKSHAEIAQLRDRLGSDRAALEAFGDRVTLLSTRAPELESKIDVILEKMKLVEGATQKAAHLHDSIAVLDAHVSRVGARVVSVEKLEGRLDTLNILSHDVGQRLEAQLARRAELDTLQSVCTGLGTEIVDAQHKLESLRVLQHRLAPMVDDIERFKGSLEAAEERLEDMRLNQTAVADQERRFQEIAAATRSINAEVADRTRQMQALAESMARSTEMKEELLADLDRVQARQRDAATQVQASDDQLSRAETMLKRLEQRRTQLAAGDQKLASIEARLFEIKQVVDDLDKSFQVIVGREQVVSAVKAEVQTVHEIGARTRADLEHVTEHRAEIAAVKSRVDDLLSRIGETEERITAIDARRRVVDEVHTKTTAVVHMLDDVRINLETLGEHRAVIDHVTDRVQQLESTLQEARNTLHTLQHERELAERIERGITQLRATGKSDELSKSATG